MAVKIICSILLIIFAIDTVQRIMRFIKKHKTSDIILTFVELAIICAFVYFIFLYK